MKVIFVTLWEVINYFKYTSACESESDGESVSFSVFVWKGKDRVL